MGIYTLNQYFNLKQPKHTHTHQTPNTYQTHTHSPNTHNTHNTPKHTHTHNTPTPRSPNLTIILCFFYLKKIVPTILLR